MSGSSSESGPPVDFPGHELGSRGFQRIRMAMFLAALATFAVLYGVQPLMPTLGRDFRITPGQSALIMSLPAISLGLSMLVVGPLSEVVGRTRIMIWSLLCSALVVIASAFAGTWPLFLLLRALLGVTLSGLTALAMAYLTEEVHSGSFARAAGLYTSGTALGGMGGRLVVGGLTQLAGWRGALLGLGVIALGCAVAFRAMLPDSRRFHPAPADAGHLLGSGLAVLRDPAILLLYAVACLSMGTFVGLFNAVVFRLEAAPYHLSVVVTGSIFVIHLVGSSSSAQAGRQADRHGFRAVAPIAAVILLSGVLLTITAPLPLIVLGLAVISAGFFALHGVAAPWVAARARRGTGGTAQATAGYLFWFYLGSSVFGWLTPVLWAWGGWRPVVAACSSATLVALGLTLTLRRIPSLQETERPDPGIIGY